MVRQMPIWCLPHLSRRSYVHETASALRLVIRLSAHAVMRLGKNGASLVPPRQGELKECRLCGRNIYSTNQVGVCSQRPTCKSFYRLIARHPGLTLDTLPKVPSHCPCCGCEFSRNERRNWPTLDRKIPALGYVPANVQWLCFRCNRIKDNATAEELIMVATFILGSE
jgi:hypothetical protein